MKRWLAILLCILSTQQASAETKCLSPENPNLRSLDFNVVNLVGLDNFASWQLLSNTFLEDSWAELPK